MSPRPQTCWRIFKENKKQNKGIKELANLACELLNERSEHRIRPTVPTLEEKKGRGGESFNPSSFFSYKGAPVQHATSGIQAPTGVV